MRNDGMGWAYRSGEIFASPNGKTCPSWDHCAWAVRLFHKQQRFIKIQAMHNLST
jgi:hypothetical protein